MFRTMAELHNKIVESTLAIKGNTYIQKGQVRSALEQRPTYFMTVATGVVVIVLYQINYTLYILYYCVNTSRYYTMQSIREHNEESFENDSTRFFIVTKIVFVLAIYNISFTLYVFIMLIKRYNFTFYALLAIFFMLLLFHINLW